MLLLLFGAQVIANEGDRTSAGYQAAHQYQQLTSRPWTPQYRTRAERDYEDKHRFGAQIIFYGRFKPLFHKTQRVHRQHQGYQHVNPVSLGKDNFAGIQNLFCDLLSGKYQHIPLVLFAFLSTQNHSNPGGKILTLNR